MICHLECWEDDRSNIPATNYEWKVRKEECKENHHDKTVFLGRDFFLLRNSVGWIGWDDQDIWSCCPGKLPREVILFHLKFQDDDDREHQSCNGNGPSIVIIIILKKSVVFLCLYLFFFVFSGNLLKIRVLRVDSRNEMILNEPENWNESVWKYLMTIEILLSICSLLSSLCSLHTPPSHYFNLNVNLNLNFIKFSEPEADVIESEMQLQEFFHFKQFVTIYAIVLPNSQWLLFVVVFFCFSFYYWKSMRNT